MNSNSTYDYTLLPMPEMILPNSAWNIIDPSKLSVFYDCPRKFFYEHILGWKKEGLNKHFVFGTAWHLAMEHLSLNGYEPSVVQEAYEKFLEYYRRYYSDITDMDNAPKNPANARTALAEYAVTYAELDSRNYETLHTEVFIVVPVNDSGRLMCGRMDKIQRHYERGIEGMDHKTGTRRDRNWEYQWKLSIQMSFYYHALIVSHPGEEIFGIIVDGVFFYKNVQKGELTKNIPVRVPIRKDNEAHQAFLSDLNTQLDFLDWNMEGLSKASPDDTVLSAFPRNPNNCINRYGYLCPFHSFCTTWANPLKRCSQVPFEFEISFWNPQEPDEKPPPRETFTVAEGFKKGENLE